MRLPFIQVDMDFLATSAGDLSELLRTSEAEAGWSMVRLWGWALTKAATPEALGLLVGSDMQRLAERAAGWKGEPGAFLEALCNPAVGLAERETEHRIRLVGMERYATTYRKMEADRARKSKRVPADVARNSSGIPSEVAGKTQTQTQTQIEASASQEPAPAASVADDIPQAADEDVQEADARPALVLVAQKPEKPARKPSKAEELYANFQAQRRERCEEAGVHWLDDGWKPQRVNAALGPLVRLDEAGKQSVADGWEAYLADDAGAVKDPPWSLGYFLASRSSWESRAARRAP